MARAKMPGLAIMIGADKPKRGADDEDMSSEDYGDAEMPEEFTEEIAEAFPDLDEARRAALWRAIRACVEV